MQLLVPRPETSTEITLAEIEERLRQTGSPLRPFDDRIVDLASAFSRAILKSREAAGYPELVALAYWMRKAELHRLREEFRQRGSSRLHLMPRGLVFHLPPSNVDTIFVYSWLLSVLAGNRNIIRLSTRSAPQSELLCRIFNQVVAQSDEAVRHNTLIVRYGHETEITAALSALCDVRVIWGGDASVNRIRTVPLPPHARELTFPDRSSLAVFHAREFLAAEDQRAIAEAFFNDLFWFDQMACSSPRQLFWIGSQGETGEASRRLLDSLRSVIEAKGYHLAPAAWIQKLVFSCRTILEQPVTRYSENAALTVLDIPDIQPEWREHCGAGLLFQVRLDRLNDLAPLLSRRDQTLTYFGFSESELAGLVDVIAGRAVDRVVPVGQALNFHRVWDGNDLLAEFTRSVWIEPVPVRTALGSRAAVLQD